MRVGCGTGGMATIKASADWRTWSCRGTGLRSDAFYLRGRDKPLCRPRRILIDGTASAAVSFLLSLRCLRTLLGPGVVAGACVGGQAGLIDHEFDGVVLVWASGGDACEGDDVKSLCIRDAVVDLAGDVVARRTAFNCPDSMFSGCSTDRRI